MSGMHLLQAMCNGVSPVTVCNDALQSLTILTTSKEQLQQAICSGNSLLLFWIVSSECFTFTNLSTMFDEFLLQAMCRGVSPVSVLAFTSHSSTSLMTSIECSLQAICNGSSFLLFWSVTSQPLEMRNAIGLLTQYAYEHEERARWRGVSPVVVTAFTLHSHTIFAISKLLWAQAICKGNSPFWFWIFLSHSLDLVRYLITSISFFIQAMCSGVLPSSVWEFTLQLLTSCTSSEDCSHAMWRGSSPFLFWTVQSHLNSVVR